MAGGPFYLFVTLRLLSCFFVQTWFVPDEFWQSTEVAHHMTFGYGYKTWEWRKGIRGSLYPSCIAAIFRLLAIVRCDHSFLLIHIPRILHALMFAVGDVQVWNLSRKLYGRPSASWTTVCLASSWFLSYCAPRTLTSCVEMVLLSAAFQCYPWKRLSESKSVSYLWWVGLACSFRPTAAVPFLPLYLHHLYRAPSKIRLLFSTFIITAFILGGTVVLDSWYYGRWIFVPWEFVEFNVISGLSSHYGTHPWHWYLTQGLPSALTTHLVPLILATFSRPTRHKSLLSVCAWSLFVYSCLGHKEIRFLLPLMPLCLCIAGDYIAFQLAAYQKRTGHSDHRKLGVLVYLVLPNLLMFLYLGLFHQRGPIEVMATLRQELRPLPTRSRILFLTPCHSTPYYSHLHRKIPMRFLTCEPNLGHKENYTDEADVFESNPVIWLDREYGEDHAASLHYIPEDHHGSSYKPLPTHIVLFDVLRLKIKGFLAHYNFRLCHDLFNSHIDDGRRSKRMLIFCR